MYPRGRRTVNQSGNSGLNKLCGPIRVVLFPAAGVGAFGSPVNSDYVSAHTGYEDLVRQCGFSLVIHIQL